MVVIVYKLRMFNLIIFCAEFLFLFFLQVARLYKFLLYFWFYFNLNILVHRTERK
jgi:hypothetical protein